MNPFRGTDFSTKLRQSAEELESMLLSDVFSKLQESFAPEGGGGADPGNGTLTGIADKALCDSLAARGGLGIGAILCRALAKRSPEVSR
jgi:Rod binding domain-containing protein